MTVYLRRPPAKGSIATWRGLGQPCVPARYLPALRPLMLLSAMRPTEGGITSPDALPGITSWDVLPSITSRRSRPRLLPKAALRLILERFFIPAKRALRPGMIFASLASRHDICRHCVPPKVASLPGEASLASAETSITRQLHES